MHENKRTKKRIRRKHLHLIKQDQLPSHSKGRENSNRSSDRAESSSFSHYWLCGKLAECESFIQDVSSLMMTPDQLMYLEVSKGRLLDISMSNDASTKRFLFELPIKTDEPSDCRLIFRVLLEHESRLAFEPLMQQLLAYQCGVYEEDDNVRIINAVISIDELPKSERRYQFHDIFTQYTDEFWEDFGPYVVNFGVLMVRLRDPKLRQKLLTTGMSTASGWYAMGVEGDKLDEKFMADLIELLRKMDDQEILKVFRPVMEYLQHRNPDYTMEALTELEKKLTGKDKVMKVALSTFDLENQRFREEGIQQGLEKGREEGREEGIEENRHSTARRMLDKGYDIRSVCEITELNKKQIAKIKRDTPSSN